MPFEQALSGNSRFPVRSLRDLLANGYIAPHPVTACERIAERYSCALSSSGRECEGIRFLRDSVAALDSQMQFAKCLWICASHTHWGAEAIIETFDRDRALFLHGPAASAETLRPISFVFTPEGPVPFEWMDESVVVSAAELEEVYRFIWQLNAVVLRSGAQLPIPLGISIDHRFKESLFDNQLFGYAEGYHGEHDGRAVVRPVLQPVVRPQDPEADLIQVTWSAFPNDHYPELRLNEAESAALARLESELANMPPDVAVRFVSEIERELRDHLSGE